MLQEKEFSQFLFTAQVSLSELDTQLIICKELGLVRGDACKILESQMETESRLIGGLIKSLKHEK